MSSSANGCSAVPDKDMGASNIFARYWRGQISLGITISIFLLLARVLLALVQPVVLIFASAPLLMFWLLFNACALAWQLGGALRSIDRTMRISGDMMSVYLCYFSMAAVIVISLLQLGDALAAVTRPSEAQTVEVIAAEPLMLSDSEGAVLIQEDLDFTTHKKLKDVLALYPGLQRVTLDSGGGRVYAARAMALTIAKHGLDTHVVGICHSACTLVFMAGKQRSMAEGAQIGFHSYRLSEHLPGESVSVNEQQVRDRDYFLSQGMSVSMANQLFKASNDTLWIPTGQELQQAGVLTSTQ